MPKIISRAEAKALGLKRYFTGKPCRRGHICERWVRNCGCIQCNSQSVNMPPGCLAARSRIFRLRHLERVRKEARERGRKHRMAYRALRELGIEI